MDQHSRVVADETIFESLKLQLASKISPFLRIEDLAKCSCVCTSWQFDFSKNEYKKAALRQGGIQKRHRPGFWASSLHVPKVQHKIITRGDIKNARTPTMYYIEYLQHHRLRSHDQSDSQGVEEQDDASSGAASLDKVGPEGEILRDVSRTFPSAALFQHEGRGQNMLANVLKACLRAEPGVGYCQGMNFVAATLLRACIEANDERRGFIEESTDGDVIKSSEVIDRGAECSPSEIAWSTSDDRQAEADAFWLMMAIMDSEKKMDMTGMWSSGVPALRLRCFQFESLLKVHIPKLYAHLKSIGLATEVLASQWFLTLFAYALPFESTVQCWDEVFLDGWTQILKVAIGHLKECEESLLPLTLEDTSRFLRSWKFSGDIFSRALLIAQTVEVTPAIVEQLQVEYGVTQLRRRLAVRGPSWLKRYGDPLYEEEGRGDNILDSLMAELMELEGVGRSDAANLRLRIETAHTAVGSAKMKLTKAETALARASGELGAAKQAKIAIAKSARDTIAAIQPNMPRAVSTPGEHTISTAVEGKHALQDGALALVSRFGFRSVSAPCSPGDAANNTNIDQDDVTVVLQPDVVDNDIVQDSDEKEVNILGEDVVIPSLSDDGSKKAVTSLYDHKPPTQLPQRPQRPPPTPPPAMLVPFPSLPDEPISPLDIPTSNGSNLDTPTPAITPNGSIDKQASSSPVPSPSSSPGPGQTVSNLALMVEDFLFGRDLERSSSSSSSIDSKESSTAVKKGRSDSFNSLPLKLPSLSFSVSDMASPLQTIAYAVSSPSGAVGSEQRLMADLRSQQKAALSAERKVVSARSRYAICLRRFKVAQADLEDAVDFKKRLSQQLLHILTMSEDEQFSKMLSMSSIFDTNASPDAAPIVTLVESEEYSV